MADCEFENDDHQNTLHLGLYFKTDLVGVVTFMKSINTEFTNTNQYQLRGMAVLQKYQGQKYGDILIIQANLW